MILATDQKNADRETLIDYLLVGHTVNLYEHMGYTRLGIGTSNSLAPGKYMTVSSSMEYLYIDLTWYKPGNPQEALIEVVNNAKFVFKHLGVPTKLHLYDDHSEDYMLVDNHDVCLGTYVHMKHDNMITGTGLIEPAFSNARSRVIAALCGNMKL